LVHRLDPLGRLMNPLSVGRNGIISPRFVGKLPGHDGSILLIQSTCIGVFPIDNFFEEVFKKLSRLFVGIKAARVLLKGIPVAIGSWRRIWYIFSIGPGIVLCHAS